jgi:hypothetical protein
MSDFHNYVASDLQFSLERMTEDRDRWRKIADDYNKGISCCPLCIEQAQYMYEQAVRGVK